MTFAVLSAAFLQGLLGFLHCPGMCGPFVVILNANDGSRLAKNILYNVGRSISYSLVGALLGLTGTLANTLFLSPVAAVVGGVLVIVMGLAYVLPGLGIERRLRPPPALAAGLARFLSRGGKSGALLLGLAGGLLPCGMLFPAYGLALSTGEPTRAAVTMLVFSLGTYPALLSVAAGSRYVLAWTSGHRKVRLALGVVLIVLGVGLIAMRMQAPHTHHESCTHSS